jgi:hypothetical protein
VVPVVGIISPKKYIKKSEKKKLIHCPPVSLVPVVGRLSHWSLWSPWWAKSKKKTEEKNQKKKLTHCHGEQAFRLVPMVPVVGRISQKNWEKNLKKKVIHCTPVPVAQ